MARRVPSTVPRRLVSVPGITLAAVVLVALTPLVAPVLVVADLVRGRTRLAAARVWLVVTGAVIVELLGLLGGFVVWVLSGFGLRTGAPPVQRAYERLKVWWVRGHLANFRLWAGVHLVVENPEAVTPGRAVVLARHRSHVDALVPVWLFGHLGGLRTTYTLKDDLQWSPALDTVGNRLPDVFVDREAGAGSVAAIRGLAAGIDDGAVAVIFPEGTFFTPERRDRAATRLARSRPDLEAPARGLDHVLPPRPAGTMALLDGAPDADVVVVGHVGLDGFGSIAEIIGSVPLDHPVAVRLWRFSRADVPDDEQERVTWLLQRWVELDQWIESRLTERAATSRRDLDRSRRGPRHAEEPAA